MSEAQKPLMAAVDQHEYATDGLGCHGVCRRRGCVRQQRTSRHPSPAADAGVVGPVQLSALLFLQGEFGP